MNPDRVILLLFGVLVKPVEFSVTTRTQNQTLFNLCINDLIGVPTHSIKRLAPDSLMLRALVNMVEIHTVVREGASTMHTGHLLTLSHICCLLFF